MKTYNWKDYGFVGTAPEFAKLHGVYKGTFFVNAVKSVSRQKYNRMDAEEQRQYERKRERAKIAYCLYLDNQMKERIVLTKEEYDKIELPVKEKEGGLFKLVYKNRELPFSFTGNGYDEIQVASAMLKFSAEAVKFAKQVMLATGYFNSRYIMDEPDIHTNYTTLTLTYKNGMTFVFDSDKCLNGVENCRLSIVNIENETIYNRYRNISYGRMQSVDNVMRLMTHNKECRNADYYL